jgi:RHS repeat-associated protein
VQERYAYFPYGQRLIFDATWATRSSSSYSWIIGHQGLRHDGTTGIIDNRMRQLHPMLGRFLQRDPAGYVDGTSLYEYCRGNPVWLSDPFGDIAPAAILLAAIVALLACAEPPIYYANKKFGNRDKLKHCYVSCHIARNCGKQAAFMGGWGRELLQRVGYYLTDNQQQLLQDLLDSQQDAAANSDGRHCAGFESYFPFCGNLGRIFRQSCEDCCRGAGY